jgi:hypothetical protein
MDLIDRQSAPEAAASPEDYWAQVQELRAQLRELRPESARR